MYAQAGFPHSSARTHSMKQTKNNPHTHSLADRCANGLPIYPSHSTSSYVPSIRCETSSPFCRVYKINSWRCSENDRSLLPNSSISALYDTGALFALIFTCIHTMYYIDHRKATLALAYEHRPRWWAIKYDREEKHTQYISFVCAVYIFRC